MRVLFGGTLAAVIAAVALMTTAPAEAGCVKGAIVGGVVGHFAGHHGLLGAGAGCAIGHHEKVKREREWERHHAYQRGYDHGRNDTR